MTRAGHEPHPYVERHGGGVRCDCGWHAEIGDPEKGGYATIKSCWDAFRRHWLAQVP